MFFGRAAPERKLGVFLEILKFSERLLVRKYPPPTLTTFCRRARAKEGGVFPTSVIDDYKSNIFIMTYRRGLLVSSASSALSARRARQCQCSPRSSRTMQVETIKKNQKNISAIDSIPKSKIYNNVNKLN